MGGVRVGQGRPPSLVLHCELDDTDGWFVATAAALAVRTPLVRLAGLTLATPQGQPMERA